MYVYYFSYKNWARLVVNFYFHSFYYDKRDIHVSFESLEQAEVYRMLGYNIK